MHSVAVRRSASAASVHGGHRTLRRQGPRGLRPQAHGNCADMLTPAVARVAANFVTLWYACIESSQSSTYLSSGKKNDAGSHAVTQARSKYADLCFVLGLV